MDNSSYFQFHDDNKRKQYIVVFDALGGALATCKLVIF